MTHSYVTGHIYIWHVSCTYDLTHLSVTWPLHMTWHITLSKSSMEHRCVCVCVCVCVHLMMVCACVHIRMSHVLVLGRAHVHDSFTGGVTHYCVTWLMYTSYDNESLLCDMTYLEVLWYWVIIVWHDSCIRLMIMSHYCVTWHNYKCYDNE